MSEEMRGMEETNEASGERLTATLNLRDPRGLHCRVAALLAYRLRVEAPHAEVTLCTPEGRHADPNPEGRHADPKMPIQTINLGARYSRVVTVEATGDDAAKVMEIVRSVVEREPLSREEVIEAIPEGVDGEIGEIRSRQKRLIEEEQDKADYDRWISPGGWLYELIGPEQLGYGSVEPEDEEV
jgi:phosphotransferase system HPr-like phosphotransfer protein